MLYEQIDISKDINWFGDGECSVIKFMPYDQSRPEEYEGRTVYNSYMLTQGKEDNGYSVYLRDIVLDGNKEGYDADILNNGSTRYDHVTCMDMYKPHNIYMHNVIIRNALIEGCYIYGPSGSVIISDCQFIQNGYKREDASGIHLEGDHRNTVINNCICAENGYHGFLFGGTQNATISNISCLDNGYDGLVLWGGASHNRISNVYSSGNRGGVYIKARYSPGEADYIPEDWYAYADGNSISGLTTSGNEYGVMFGFSKNTIIDGWMSHGDTYSVAFAINESDGADEYQTDDITGCVSNAVFDFVRAKAYKMQADTSKFKFGLISSTSDLVGNDDFYNPPISTDIAWELGSISTSSGGQNEDSDTAIRTVGYLACEPNTTYTVTFSSKGDFAIYWYSDSNGSFIHRDYVEYGETVTSPSNATYLRIKIDPETNLNTTVSFDPQLPG